MVCGPFKTKKIGERMQMWLWNGAWAIFKHSNQLKYVPPFKLAAYSKRRSSA